MLAAMNSTISFPAVAGYVLVYPSTGRYFDGTNFAADASGAKLFPVAPHLSVVRNIWPLAELRVMTTSGNILPA